LEGLPEIEAAIQAKGFGCAEDLYREFIATMRTFAESRNKTLRVWEGEHNLHHDRNPVLLSCSAVILCYLAVYHHLDVCRAGFGPQSGRPNGHKQINASSVRIPAKNLEISIFDSVYYAPNQAAVDGYKLINSATAPLYVNQGTTTQRQIYAWHPWLFGDLAYAGYESWVRLSNILVVCVCLCLCLCKVYVLVYTLACLLIMFVQWELSTPQERSALQGCQICDWGAPGASQLQVKNIYKPPVTRPSPHTHTASSCWCEFLRVIPCYLSLSDLLVRYSACGSSCPLFQTGSTTLRRCEALPTSQSDMGAPTHGWGCCSPRPPANLRPGRRRRRRRRRA